MSSTVGLPVFPESNSFCHGVKVNSNGTMDPLGFLDHRQQERCLAYLSKNIFIGWNLLDVLLDRNQCRNKSNAGYLRFQKLIHLLSQAPVQKWMWLNPFFPPISCRSAGDSHFWEREANRLMLGLIPAARLGRKSTSLTVPPISSTMGER